VAFIRRKKVHEYEYYQVVRNYRGRDGKHRQEVLCHLGVHSSLESAIAAAREKVKVHREEAAQHRRHANAIRATHQKHFGWESDVGEFPSKEEAELKLEYWWDRYYSPRTFYSGTEFMDIEEIQIQIEKYMRCLTYYGALQLASMSDARADTYQVKLDKLLRVQHECF
jgi:hypothetical protein